MLYPRLQLAWLLLLGLCLGGCDQAARQQSLARQALQLRKVELAAVFVPCKRTSTSPMAGILARSHCLDFSVPENPEAPQGRQIILPVIIIPAIRPLSEPDPLVILVGGPGQSATVDGLAVLPIFEQIRQSRDILLIDQRGTGPRSSLNCEFAEPEPESAFAMNAELLLEIQNEFLERCLAGLDADPRFYTTDIGVQDLEAVRQYLGYTRFNLWGVSYGTRVALNFLRYFPESVRSVVIDGVAPPGVLPLEAARDAGRVLERVLALCGEEAECTAAFPELPAHYEALMQRYSSALPVILQQPGKSAPETIDISSANLQSILFTMLYSRETARLIPLYIESMYAGNFQPLAGLQGAGGSAINLPMHYSVICSEDLPLMAPLVPSDAQSLFLYDTLVKPRVEGCKIWPTKPMPQEFFSPVVSSKPVLIFSATQDPVTPRRWGDEVAQTLPNSLHLEAKGVGHGVFAYGCAPRLIAAFVATASVSGLEVQCLDELNTRPFFVSAGGSALSDD